MKKSILSLMVGAIVALASCSQSDEMPGQPQEGEQLATFTIQTPAATRADVTSSMHRFIVEAYEGATATGTPAARVEADNGTLTLTLKKNTEYTFLFWADGGTAKTESAESSGYWNTDDLKAVTVTTGKENNNGEVAYCLATTFNSADFNTHSTVTLKNATAQVNFIEKTGLTSTSNTLAVTYSAGVTLNVGTGKVTTVAGKITHTFAVIAQATSGATLATDYILAPKDEQQMLDLTIRLNTEDPKTLTNVPFEQCFKTNITGEYSSLGQFTFTVTADNEWETPDKDVPLVQAKVGDYYYKDGTWSSENKATDANPVIGVIYQVNADGGGKVVSLTEPTGMWTTSGNTTATGATSRTDGKGNTDKILTGISGGTYTLDNYPIFKACKELRTSTGNDGWYIPVMTEYYDLFKNVSEINEKIKAINGVELVAPTGDSNAYWSSEENNQSAAFQLTSSSGGESINKANALRVRFVLDF